MGIKMSESPELEILHATIERVWNEYDDAKRLAAIGDLYHRDAQIFEPARAVTGHQAISDVVKGVLADMPQGFTFKVLPGGHGHHGIATAQWTGGPGDQVIVSGADVARIADGKVIEHYFFFDAAG